MGVSTKPMWKILLPIVVIVSLSTIALLSRQARANFGSEPPTCTVGYCSTWCTVCTANNKWHAVKFSALTRTWVNNMQGAINYYNSNTDMSVYRNDSDPTYDVKVKDWYYGDNGFAGWVGCYGDNSGTGWNCGYRYCRGMVLRINLDEASRDYAYRVALARHELGHTVGLKHGSFSSVMYPIVSGSYQELTSIEKVQVNLCY